MIGRVYKITSEKAGLVYIGSTSNTLGERLYRHKCDMKRWLAGKKKYGEAYKLLEFDDAKMELIEELEVADRNELFKREGYYQRTMECVNRCIAGRSRKEYYDDNKDELKTRCKKYKDEHKEEINAKHTCECGGRYANPYKSRHIKSKKHQDYINQIERLNVL
jgi:adenylate kinase family enzyme